MPQKNPPMNGRSMLKHIVTKYDNTSHNTIQIEPNKTKSPSNFLGGMAFAKYSQK